MKKSNRAEFIGIFICLFLFLFFTFSKTKGTSLFVDSKPNMGSKLVAIIATGTIAILQFVCVVQCLDLDLLNKQATYLDTKVGSYAVFNCPLDFPQDIEIPYILHWNKEVSWYAMRLFIVYSM